LTLSFFSVLLLKRMKRTKTRKHAVEQAENPVQSFQQVFDAKEQRVRGLWIRNGVYHAQLDATDGKQYKYPMHGAKTVPQAVTGRQALKKIQTEGELLPPLELRKFQEGQARTGLITPPPPNTNPPTGGTAASETNAPASRDCEAEQNPVADKKVPISTEDAIDGYCASRTALESKKEATGSREDSSLAHWKLKFGKMALADLRGATLLEYAVWRKKEHKVSGRTINLDVMAISQVIQWGRDWGHLPLDHPDPKWKKLPENPAEDELLETEQIDAMCQAAMLDPEALELVDVRFRHLRAGQAVSGQAFHDYQRLLQHAGGREHETTLQRWKNVTWSRVAEFDGDCDKKKGEVIAGNLFFPGKFAKAGGGRPAKDRWVDFHADLEAHLRAMWERRDPRFDWMFPCRGEDSPVKRYNAQLNRVKSQLRKKFEADPAVSDGEKKKSQWFDRVTFQWFRHYFISHAVMAGIDFKTIATWVSHRDGGILIGRVYGHLERSHSRRMAVKLSGHLSNHA
jgi:integrase